MSTPINGKKSAKRRNWPISQGLALLMIISIVFCCTPARSAQTQEAENSQFDTSAERIGGLRLGLPEKDVNRNIPCPPVKGKEIYEGATGEHVQTWKYPECGIVLKMSSERKGGAKTVGSITITSPSDLATSGGIRIGSAESEVLKAYNRYLDRENTKKGRNFTAGSIYDGIIFDFKNGKVVRIFLGAAAE